LVFGFERNDDDLHFASENFFTNGKWEFIVIPLDAENQKKIKAFSPNNQ
jgi:hypothetical protein